MIPRYLYINGSIFPTPKNGRDFLVFDISFTSKPFCVNISCAGQSDSGLYLKYFLIRTAKVFKLLVRALLDYFSVLKHDYLIGF